MHTGALIGKGMSAEVYEWCSDKVIKLYHESFSEEGINYELDMGIKVYDSGVPSPETFGRVEYEGRKGLLFERILGKSMLKLSEEKPWRVIHYIKKMAHVHSDIHNCKSVELPKQKRIIKEAIQQSQDILGERAKRIIDYLYHLPEDNSVCHGDFHPDNIILSDQKATAIDWTNAHSGNASGDVARTCLLIKTPFMSADIPPLKSFVLKSAKALLNSIYLKEYTSLTNTTYEAIEAWLLPVAAARLREKIPGEQEWLLRMIDKRLK